MLDNNYSYSQSIDRNALRLLQEVYVEPM